MEKKKIVAIKNFSELIKKVKSGDLVNLFHTKEKKFKQVQFVKKLTSDRLQAINYCNGVIWDLSKRHFDEKIFDKVSIGRNEKIRQYDKNQVKKHLSRFSEDRKLYGDLIKKFGFTFSEKE